MSVGKTIKDYFKEHKLKTCLIVLAIAAVTVLSLLPAQILRIIVDDVIKEEKAQRLLAAALIYAGTYILIGIVTFLKDLIMLSASQSVTMKLRGNMMKHVHQMSYKELVNTDSGTLEAYFNNDVNSINELFTSGVVNMTTDLFKMIGIVISIFIYSAVFGGIVLALLPVLLAFTSFVRKRMLKAQLKTKSLEGNVNKSLLENVENIEQIKVNKAEEYASHKYISILQSHFRVSQASNFYDAMFSPVMQIIRNLVVCGVLLVSGYNSSVFGLSIGMIISAITLLTDLFTPIENLGMEIQTIQKSVAAVKRINEFFKLTADDPKTEEVPKGSTVVLKNVSFAYENKPVIEDFSLTIQPGEKIALQGPSGVGKSTLLKLMMGLLKPTGGEVTIGGVSSYALADEAKRKLFSIVYQDPFFSGGTIYEEITLKNNEISREEVLESLKAVGLEYIQDIDIILNDKEYSSGELALFNIARVIVQKPEIIFLDEMNAKLDSLTGKQIISLINQFSKDKIVISINHYGDILENAKIIRMG